MDERIHEISHFLSGTEWETAEQLVLFGDASARKYRRLVDRENGISAILMDTPKELISSVESFVNIDIHLLNVGLSAPEIYRADIESGFLLLEDFGDDLFANILLETPALETELYNGAVDCLVHLHQQGAPKNATEYSPTYMTEVAVLAYDWYAVGILGNVPKDPKTTFSIELQAMLEAAKPSNPVLALRDFHAENLVWLPARTGAKKIGLLDFQDAMLCHQIYDLVSLLQDARRDVSPLLTLPIIRRYAELRGLNEEECHRDFALYGAQRNLRILGVFARLCMLHGKPQYVDLIPRVWTHMFKCLDHPSLENLRTMVEKDLPKPTPRALKTLRDKCATIQKQ